LGFRAHAKLSTGVTHVGVQRTLNNISAEILIRQEQAGALAKDIIVLNWAAISLQSAQAGLDMSVFQTTMAASIRFSDDATLGYSSKPFM
jgi:hypothetical protein